MLHFWKPQDKSKQIRGASKFPEHHQEDQEAQGCIPSMINNQGVHKHYEYFWCVFKIRMST